MSNCKNATHETPVPDFKSWAENLIKNSKEKFSEPELADLNEQIQKTIDQPCKLSANEMKNKLKVIRSQEDLQDLKTTLTDSPIVVSIATNREGEFVGMCIQTQDTAYYIPIGHRLPDSNQLLSEQLDPIEVASVFDNLKGVVAAHDAKKLLIWLMQHGVNGPIEMWDTAIADKLQHGEKDFELEEIVKRELDVPLFSIADKPNDPIEKYAVDKLATKLHERSKAIQKLSNKQRAGLEDDFISCEVEQPLVPIVADMERVGYRVDSKYFRKLSSELQATKQKLIEELKPLTWEGFNPSSDSVVRKFLYDKLKLPPSKHTKTGNPSVDSETLNRFSKQSPAIPLLMAYREVSKALSTYISKLNSPDGDDRYRYSFDQLGAKTGRFTCAGIIQTIPSDDKFGIRRGFIADPGKKLVTADYKQQETCVLAAVTGDRSLRAAIQDGVDLHGLIAVKIFGLECEPNEVKSLYPDKRAQAKVLLFGLIYGQTAYGLAKKLGVSDYDAEEIMRDFFEDFPRVRSFISKVHREVQQTGSVTDLFGRTRKLPDALLTLPDRDAKLRAERRGKIAAAKRAAQNFLIQGPAATITKLAMIRCAKRITQGYADSAKMILTLHDELHFEVADDVVADFVSELPSLMCNLGLERFGFDVPLSVGIKVGANWADAKEWGVSL